MLARIVTNVEEGIVSLLLVVMTLVVFVEVVLRFGFNTGMIWADELVLHLSAWMVLLGASYGVKVGSHIGVDAVVRLLPSAVRRVVTLVAIVLCLIYCWLFIQGSWVYLQKVHRIGIELEDLPIEKWLAHSILLIGFVLLAIRFLMLGWHVLQGKSDSFGFADEAKEALETLGADVDRQGGGEEAVTTAALFLLLFVCMLMGMPIAIALGFSSIVTILLFSNDSLASISLKLLQGLSGHYTLLAIPFFILSSAFLTTGGVARRLIRFAISTVGYIRGGLAMASVLACMLFAAISGSSPATVAAIGSLVITGMVKAGYPEKMAAGVITNAGTLGILIPPSIVMLVYAAATEQSAAQDVHGRVHPRHHPRGDADGGDLRRRQDQGAVGAAFRGLRRDRRLRPGAPWAASC